MELYIWLVNVINMDNGRVTKNLFDNKPDGTMTVVKYRKLCKSYEYQEMDTRTREKQEWASLSK